MSVGSTQKNNNTQSALVFNVCIHIFCVLYLTYQEVYVGLSVVSYSPSAEHGGSNGEPSIWGPRGWGLNFKKILFCFLCHHKDNKYGCLFSSRYQHYTNYCPVSTPAYINCVVVMRVLVDHHCLRAWEALVESDLGCRKSFQLTSVRCKEMTLYSLA